MKRLAMLALVLAAIAVAEPLVDGCPLRIGGPNTCPWCAGALAAAGVHRPAVVPSLVVAYQLIATPCAGHSYDAPLVIPSRAPPAL